MKNPSAVALGRMARGHKKTLSMDERERRREWGRHLATIRKARKSKLRPGQKVTVYYDPYTKLQPEGVAELKRLQYHGHDMEYWWVRFGDDEKDVCRRIYPGQRLTHSP